MAGPNRPIIEQHYTANITTNVQKLSNDGVTRVGGLLSAMFQGGSTNISLPLGQDEKYPVGDGEAPGIGMQHMMTLGLLDKSK